MLKLRLENNGIKWYHIQNNSLERKNRNYNFRSPLQKRIAKGEWVE